MDDDRDGAALYVLWAKRGGRGKAFAHGWHFAEGSISLHVHVYVTVRWPTTETLPQFSPHHVDTTNVFKRKTFVA